MMSFIVILIGITCCIPAFVWQRRANIRAAKDGLVDFQNAVDSSYEAKETLIAKQ